MITVTVNGKDTTLETSVTVAEFIELQGFNRDAAVVERNRMIVKKQEWAVTALYDGDRLEVLSFVGGG